MKLFVEAKNKTFTYTHKQALQVCKCAFEKIHATKKTTPSENNCFNQIYSLKLSSNQNAPLVYRPIRMLRCWASSNHNSTSLPHSTSSSSLDGGVVDFFAGVDGWIPVYPAEKTCENTFKKMTCESLKKTNSFKVLFFVLYF